MSLRRRNLVAAVAVCFMAGSLFAFAVRLLTPPQDAVNTINATELREHLAFLTSDELGGRYTLSPNFPIAARYLATRLQAYGYKPAGENGSYLQHFDVVSSRAKPDDCALGLTIGGARSDFKFGDFIPTSAMSGNAEGQVVFVGYGVSAPEQKHDDYAGLDVHGKIVLLAGGLPKGLDDAALKAEEDGEGAARAHGAAGVMSLPNPRFLNFMRNPQFREAATRRPSVRLARDVENSLPAVMLGPDATAKLLALMGTDLDKVFASSQAGGELQPKALDATAEIKVVLDSSRITTQNVAGILPGSDPRLRDEYVAYSAHYDHLQTNAQGKIYPGADDDGSGTTSVLTIAKALAMHPPKRSVLIIFHAGEELGLLGSRFNTDFGHAVPMEKIVADLNIDMIGRSRPAGDTDERDKNLTDANSVYLVGADRISKELNTISEDTDHQFEKLNLNYLYNDPRNPERIYYRSDHWNYAKHGVPIIFYFDGTHVDYHQPTDTIDKIDFTKMTRIARLVYETGWQLGNMEHRLVIDKPAAATAAGGQ